MIHALLPFMIFSILTSMKAIDQRLLTAASGLGANKLRVFLHIYLPLTYSGMISGSLIVFLMSLGYFITPALLGGRKEMMLGQLIEFHVSETLNWPYASALSMILFALILCIVMLYVRVSTKGVR
jgi:ABC-type spermidine/putrescine transport system permease subunit I